LNGCIYDALLHHQGRLNRMLVLLSFVVGFVIVL
jgi:hypothetical protein